jgi:hypothetical protein
MILTTNSPFVPVVLPGPTPTDKFTLFDNHPLWLCNSTYTLPEVGKVTLKSNGDEALSDESLLKNNSDEALNDDFPQKVTVMKRLTLRTKL